MPTLLNYRGIISCSKSVWMMLSALWFSYTLPQGKHQGLGARTAPWTVAEGDVMTGVHLSVQGCIHIKQMPKLGLGELVEGLRKNEDGFLMPVSSMSMRMFSRRAQSHSNE